MAKRVGTPENRELAFRVYAQFGGRNVPGILARLDEEHGIRISTQTLYTWKREGEWEKRLGGEQPTYEQFALRKMMGIIEKFERKLAEGPEDPQTAYAYTNMLSTFFRLSKKVRPLKPDPEVMRRKAQEILERDYGITREKARAIAYKDVPAARRSLK